MKNASDIGFSWQFVHTKKEDLSCLTIYIDSRAAFQAQALLLSLDEDPNTSNILGGREFEIWPSPGTGYGFQGMVGSIGDQGNSTSGHLLALAMVSKAWEAARETKGIRHLTISWYWLWFPRHGGLQGRPREFDI